MRLGALVEEGGTRFRVWAPRPRSVELEVKGRRVPMGDLGSGVKEVFAPGVGAGDRYAYLLDGERRRPDPVSRAQPEGVHGPSQVVDPGAFRWSGGYGGPDRRTAALYELHVGTFSPEGTFAGVAARLDEIAGAGFDVIEIMPVAAFPGERNWGYDGVHWLAPHAAYGGPEGLRELVDACHRRGMGVVLDAVWNHFGPEGNYLGEFAPYFRRDRATPWGEALDLDGPGAGPVRAHVIGCARALVEEFRLDGMRLDAVHAIEDASPVHLVAELGAALYADAAARGRPVWVIAESDLGEAKVVEPAGDGGWGCDALWADDFHHALHAAITGERAGYYADFGRGAEVARALERGFVQTGRRVGFRGRNYGTPAAHLDGERLVICAQNHDQVGNRTFGERLAVLAPGCEYAVAALVMTAPFVPLVFMGEEHGERAPFLYFTSFGDPALGRAVAEGRRRERGEGAPNPQELQTFDRSRLDPERGGAAGAALRGWYRALAALRRSRPSLACGRPGRTEAVAEGAALVVRRGAALDETIIACSLGGARAEVALPAPRRGRWRLLLDAGEQGGPRGARIEGDRIALPPWGAVILGAPQ